MFLSCILSILGKKIREKMALKIDNPENKITSSAAMVINLVSNRRLSELHSYYWRDHDHGEDR